jgi:DNA polymerase III epsilon subunit-like protein
VGWAVIDFEATGTIYPHNRVIEIGAVHVDRDGSVGRTTYISLQIHAGLSPVTVAALAGNLPDIIWKHYAREFERSKTTRQIDLESAVRAARRSVAHDRVRTVFARCSHETMSSSCGDMRRARKTPLMRANIALVKLLG